MTTEIIHAEELPPGDYQLVLDAIAQLSRDMHDRTRAMSTALTDVASRSVETDRRLEQFAHELSQQQANAIARENELFSQFTADRAERVERQRQTDQRHEQLLGAIKDGLQEALSAVGDERAERTAAIAAERAERVAFFTALQNRVGDLFNWVIFLTVLVFVVVFVAAVTALVLYWYINGTLPVPGVPTGVTLLAVQVLDG